MSPPRADLHPGRSSASSGLAGWFRRPAVACRALAWLAAAGLAAAGRRWRIRCNRRATLALLELDAERLADIGLTRADVHVALFDPRSPDPTGMLDALAAERRRPGRRVG